MFSLSSKLSKPFMACKPTSMLTQMPSVMFGGGHALRPATENGRIKVTDHIIWINCVPPDGVPRRMAARAGESLLEVLNRHKMPGIHPDCDGGDNEN